MTGSVRLVAAASAALMIASVMAAAAAARTAEWSHPRGLYSLEVSDWRHLEGEPLPEGDIVMFEGGADGFPMCSVREQAMPHGLTQETLNTRLSGFSPPSTPQIQVSDRVSSLKDGVAIVDYALRVPAEQVWTRERTFVIVEDAATARHEISCGGFGAPDALALAKIERLFASLHFMPRDNP